jgi:hypothetical protein
MRWQRDGAICHGAPAASKSTASDSAASESITTTTDATAAESNTTTTDATAADATSDATTSDATAELQFVSRILMSDSRMQHVFI